MNAKPTPRIITGSASVFLDALRLFSALVVVFVHAYDQWFPTGDAEHEYIFRKAAHSAVVYFFVISGFVISYTTINNNRGSLQYAQARLSRLCSVLLPALLITLLAQLIVWWRDPELLSQFSRGSSVVRYGLSALFLNEIWTLSAAPPINIALWSLSYEFWYYVIFGLWFYRNKSKGLSSLLPALFACLFAGPKILLMMPIWIMGCLAYAFPAPKISVTKSWIAVIGLMTAGIFTLIVVQPYPADIGAKPFFFSNRFLTDYLIGIFFSLALWIMPLSTKKVTASSKVVFFRKVADLTFPIYVLHYPLIVLWRAFIPLEQNNGTQMGLAIGSVLILVSIIGYVLENQRNYWVNLFGILLKYFTKNVFYKRAFKTPKQQELSETNT